MIRPPPRSTLFPYPTLSQSCCVSRVGPYPPRPLTWCGARRPSLALRPTRSEEHTSELQSRLHIVCRLLLEKKTDAAEIVEKGLRMIRLKNVTKSYPARAEED